MKPVRIGTRESVLAVIQSEMVGDYLTGIGMEYELVKMKTTGDKILNKTFVQIMESLGYDVELTYVKREN